MASRLSRQKRWTFAALAVVSALGVGLVVAEVALRAAERRFRAYFTDLGRLGLVTRASADPDLIWEYAPNATSADDWGPLVTNAFGFRERPLDSPAKREGVRRVAVVGDSVTVGLFVAAEETFARRAEALLEREHGRPDVEVLAFAVDGYDAAQVAALLAGKVATFEPDAVVYAMCLNDFDSELSSAEKRRFFRPQRWQVAAAMRRAWLTLRARSMGFHRYVFERGHADVWGSIRAMRGTCEALGAPLHVAVLPLFPLEGWQPAFAGEPRGTMREYPAAWGELRDGVLEFLAGEGLPALDLVPAFADVGDPAEVARDIWHPNAEGHARIGAALAEFLAARL